MTIPELNQLRHCLMEKYVYLLECERDRRGFKEAAEEDLMSTIVWIDMWMKELEKTQEKVVS